MIAVEDLTVHSGAFRLEGVSFQIRTGGYGVLMGKTGCGKTTVLEAICGLRPVSGGRILLDGRDVTDLRPGERGIGYVPQDLALFRTMSVHGNLAFALTLKEWSKAEIAARVDELAGFLGLGDLLDRRTRGLSGGEAQRVALGRALAARPSVLCLDEPLTALDDETRDEMVDLLKTVRTKTGVTTIHITHSREEAQRLADPLFRMKDGVVDPAAVEDVK